MRYSRDNIDDKGWEWGIDSDSSIWWVNINNKGLGGDKGREGNKGGYGVCLLLNPRV